MRVLLINPPIHAKGWKFKSEKHAAVTPPLGLASIAAVLRNCSYNVKILDALVEGFSINEIIDRVKEFSPDVVGLGVMTITYKQAKLIIKEIKENCKNIFVIMGGSHVSASPIETLQDIPELDAICIGEGEYTFKELVENLKNKKNLLKVKGLAFRKGSKIIKNKPRPLIKNLDELPFPARDLLPNEKYRFGIKVKRKPVTAVIPSRGCPFSCIYCCKSVFKKSYRAHSPEYVISEIKYLIKEYGIKEIVFNADTLLSDHKWVEKLCNMMIEQKINIAWCCSGRADQVSAPLLKKMKKAGCWYINFGLESGNSEVLKIIKKGTPLEKIKEAVKLTKKEGIKVTANFMIGLPGDTKKSIEDTINFALSLPIDFASFHITAPLPGSELYDTIEKYGSLDKDWAKFRTEGSKIAFVAKGLSKEFLKKKQKEAYIKFYFRPKYILRILFDIKNIIYFKKHFKEFLSFFHLSGTHC